jgi:hypothetical protein
MRRLWFFIAATAAMLTLFFSFVLSAPHDLVQVPVFDGKTLAGWHTLGKADWRVANGEIVGSGQGGWLVMDRVYEDAILGLSVQCKGCTTGVMLRSRKDGDRTNGVYVSLSGEDVGKVYRVTLDAQGQEVDRKLFDPPPPSPAGGVIDKGGCPPVPCVGITGAHGGAMSTGGSRATAPQIKLDPSGWNPIQVTARGDVVIGTVNGTRMGLVDWDRGSRFGQMALRVSGGEVHVKGISVWDLTQRPAALPTEVTDPGWRKIQLTDLFYAEGIAAGDVTHDGIQDIIVGPFYYAGPDYKVAREIFPPATINPSGFVMESGPEQPQAGAIVHGSYTPNFMTFVYDFNGDGWQDVLQIMGFGPRPTFSGHLFINPRGEPRHWDNTEVVNVITTEVNELVDIDGDGKPELLGQTGVKPDWSDSQFGYWKPDWSDTTKMWKFIPVSEPGRYGGHGGGFGDVNKDGRLDMLAPAGWWEQPPKGTTGLWPFHRIPFLPPAVSGPGAGGDNMFLYDFNGDGLPDMISSVAAHGVGLAWWEQKKDGTWAQHTIVGDPLTPMAERSGWAETDKSFAPIELHATAFADIDGDGVPDLVTGKRWYSHGYRYEENDVDAPPAMYWFKTVRKGNQVSFEPHMINNNSGLGTQIWAVDVNGDGAPDVLTTARKGAFVFLNRTRTRR